MRRARAAAAFSIAFLALAAGARAAESLAFSSATLTCDDMEYVSSGSVVTARGNAVLLSSGTRLEADELRIYLSSHTLEARGHVYLEENGMALVAESASFDSAASTGVFMNGYLEDPPYRLWARRIVRVSSELYHMEHAAVTSCDRDPPHYHVRMASLDYVPQTSGSAWWPRLALGDDSVLGLPFYHKTFNDKKPWTLTVDPGHSSYNGYFTKSIFTYRLTDYGTARAYWDHFNRTGDGLGGEYTYSTSTVQGTLYGYRINDRVSGSERWNIRASHWERLAPRLSLQINALAQSDSNFNNVFFRDDLNRVSLTEQSNGALSYQHPYFTSRLSVTNNEAFDPARSGFVRQNTVFPELSFQGSPWKTAKDTYLTLAGAVRSQYDRPLALPPALDPVVADQDRSRRTGDGSLNVSRKISLGRAITLEPSAGISGNWQSWRNDGPLMDPHDLYQGRVFTGLTFRERVTRNFDYDLTHAYRVRWAPDRLQRDHSSVVDQGLEANQLSLISNYRLDTASARLATGYDLRQTDGETLRTPRRSFTPPALDLSWRPSRETSFSYREVYALFPARHPETTEFSWRLGRSPDLQFSSGFSYNAGLPGQLQFRHGVAFPLTPGWQAQANVRYVLQGVDGLRVGSVPRERFEQEYVLVRDLHCWDSRITFRKRPGLTETYIRVELKTGAATRQQMRSPVEKQYYPGRDEVR